MRSSVKQLMINIILSFAILIVIATFYLSFIAGPNRAYEEEDRLAVEAMMKQEGYQKASILNRFSFDSVYYITKVDIQEEPSIVWFKKDLSKIVIEPYYELERMKDIAGQYGIDLNKINYGVYEDELVYVLKTLEFEAFFRASDLQVVYHLGSEI